MYIYTRFWVNIGFVILMFSGSHGLNRLCAKRLVKYMGGCSQIPSAWVLPNSFLLGAPEFLPLGYTKKTQEKSKRNTRFWVNIGFVILVFSGGEGGFMMAPSARGDGYFRANIHVMSVFVCVFVCIRVPHSRPTFLHSRPTFPHSRPGPVFRTRTYIHTHRHAIIQTHTCTLYVEYYICIYTHASEWT